MAILEADNLTKVYGHGGTAVTALDHINLSVAPQEFVAIMQALDLPRPIKMEVAVPANRACGETSEGKPAA